MNNVNEYLCQKSHNHYASGHKIRSAIYNRLNNAYLRFDAAKRSGAWSHPIKTAKSYMREHSRHPEKYAEEDIRPLVKSVNEYVNPKRHNKGDGVNGKEDMNPWVDVIGRKRNMEGIKKVQHLVEAYNYNCAEDGIKWQFDDNSNGSAGAGKRVHYTLTGKDLPAFRLKPTDGSIEKFNVEELQNSSNKLSEYMNRYTDFGLDSFFIDKPPSATEL